MNLWDDPKFKQPSDAVGDWSVKRSASFEHTDDPLAVKHLVEKMTAQLLRRDPPDADAMTPTLSYSGSSRLGHPSAVRLELAAVMGDRKLYRLTSERTAPKRWEDEDRFTADCDRSFAFWCSKLRVVTSTHEWVNAPAAALEQTIRVAIAAEDAAAQIVEDPAPIAAIQQEVLAALRSGMGFATAHKEGGTRLFFDGQVFRRDDHGEEPNLHEVYPDDAAMLDGLRRFYDWDARQSNYPHPVPELQVWTYIRGQLQSRRG
jgi:hypothetical protein